MSEQKKYILDTETANRKIQRMAYEIWENNLDEGTIILAGIRERGHVIASCIKQQLAAISNIKIEQIQVQLDKDKPSTVVLSKEMDFTGKCILLVDDVANSGKTLLYALKPFLDFHPRKIETLVLVARSHKTFPVYPDYVGLPIATTLEEHIYVEVEGNQVKGAYLA